MHIQNNINKMSKPNGFYVIGHHIYENCNGVYYYKHVAHDSFVFIGSLKHVQDFVIKTHGGLLGKSLLKRCHLFKSYDDYLHHGDKKLFHHYVNNKSLLDITLEDFFETYFSDVPCEGSTGFNGTTMESSKDEVKDTSDNGFTCISETNEYIYKRHKKTQNK